MSVAGPQAYPKAPSPVLAERWKILVQKKIVAFLMPGR